jgi:predicted XRE-type DNA-binding protein
MSDDDFEMIRGTGNVFRDFNVEVLQFKAVLAGKIVYVLDEQKITVRHAGRADRVFSGRLFCVRRAKLQRFMIDRLVGMLGKLNQDVELSVSIRMQAAVPGVARDRYRRPHCNCDPPRPR